MIALLQNVATALSLAWAVLLIAVLFGLMPGIALRLLVLAFRADDPRRKELIGEFRAIKSHDRPTWIFSQIDYIFCDGLLERLASGRRTPTVATKRITVTRMTQWNVMAIGDTLTLPSDNGELRTLVVCDLAT